jgi:hypothetical protein
MCEPFTQSEQSQGIFDSQSNSDLASNLNTLRDRDEDFKIEQVRANAQAIQRL